MPTLTQAVFEAALKRLWPNGDQKVPGLRAGIIATALAVFDKYGISNTLLVAHVMAQISHECGAGHDVVENLSYTAQRMTQVWPSRFPTVASAAPYAHNPRALANKVYNGRMGNRTGTDDGYNFRGRGGSQTTGREGYERVKKQTGLDVVGNPDILIDPKFFLTCAVSDFINCGCLPFAKADDVLNVTRKLNGGTVGLAERKAWLAKWKAALGTGAVAAPSAPMSAPPTVSPTPMTPAAKPEPVKPAAPAVAPSKPVEAPKKVSWLTSLLNGLAAAFKRKPDRVS
jgi:putative chitinase